MGAVKEWWLGRNPETQGVIDRGVQRARVGSMALDETRDYSRALLQTLGDRGSLAELRNRQQQAQQAGALAAASREGGLGQTLATAAPQLGQQAMAQGNAMGQENVENTSQLAGVTAQQRDVDLGQMGLGAHLAGTGLRYDVPETGALTGLMQIGGGIVGGIYGGPKGAQMGMNAGEGFGSMASDIGRGR